MCVFIWALHGKEDHRIRAAYSQAPEDQEDWSDDEGGHGQEQRSLTGGACEPSTPSGDATVAKKLASADSAALLGDGEGEVAFADRGYLTRMMVRPHKCAGTHLVSVMLAVIG